MFNGNNNNNNSKNSSEYKQYCSMNMNPRISFSNDFVESWSSSSGSSSTSGTATTTHSQHSVSSSDFEFSGVPSYSMMSADQLFSKGRLLPFKNNQKTTAVTLRDELLSGEDDNDGGGGGGGSQGVSLMRPPKSGSSGRWKGLLGLRKSSKKADNGPSARSTGLVHHEDVQLSGTQNFTGSSQ